MHISKNVFIILNSLLYEILSFLSQAKGIVLNPVSTKYYTYCIGKDEPIILTNPFPDILHGAGLDHLVGMEWYRNVSGNQVKLTSALEPFQSPVPKIVSYEKWGLQINSVSPKDSGVYLAIMSSTTYTTRQTAVNIFVASYPVLKSESLSVKETTNGGGSKTYSCGQIAFLGQPPINIIMKGSDGTVLPSTYRDGYQLVTLPYSKDGQQVTCEVDKNSTAYHCIPEADLSRWGLPTIKEPHTANSNFLIYFIAVGFVGLLLIVILVVVGGKKYFLRQRESDLEGHDHDNHDDLVLPEVKDKDFSEVDMSLDKRTTNNINSSLSYPASSLSYQPKQQEDYKKYEVNGKGRLS